MDLSRTIDQAAQAVDGRRFREKSFPNDNFHLNPGRWWLFSLAFPMMAGTLGPVASAFSICALGQPWRQQLVSGGSIQDATYIPNPTWLTIVNSIQLAIAVPSNMILFFNMAKKVRFSLAMPITIVGWCISAIMRIVLAATAAGPLRTGLKFPDSELVWSQAYFYGIYGAIVYTFVACLMILTFWGALAGLYSKEFTLTLNQRTLMLQSIIYLLYLLIGARVFSAVEGWSYLDAVYWADVTLFTVGFGDEAPKTTLGRALLIPYVIFGIISLALVIDSVRNLILERGKRPFAIRLEEKARRKVVRAMMRKQTDEMLEPIRGGPKGSRTQWTSIAMTEYERRRSEFNLMRNIQHKALRRRRWIFMATSTTLWLTLWLVGAAIFVKCENPYQGWSYFDAFYFSFIAWTTVGYGDLTPVSNAGRSFFVFWSLLALPTITMVISHAGDTVVRIIRYGTIQLGNVTILPGEEGFLNNLKHIISTITLGAAFPTHLDSATLASAQSSAGDHSPSITVNSGSRMRTWGGHPGDQNIAHDYQSICHGRHSKHTELSIQSTFAHFRNPHDELPKGTNFHFLLISEIQAVASHLTEREPHRYTFDQWAWYLKLLGEDEHTVRTHCKAKELESLQGTHERANKELVWSWVGSRNPLLGIEEESEWILNRLTERLRESLILERRAQLLGVGRDEDSEWHARA